jgi:hypothetical protein
MTSPVGGADRSSHYKARAKLLARKYPFKINRKAEFAEFRVSAECRCSLLLESKAAKLLCSAKK